MDPVTELHQASAGLADLPRVIAEEGSVAARQAILDTVAARRGTLSVSGLAATLDVTTSATSGDGTAQASLRAVPAGAWALVDKGADAHIERRRRGMPTPYGVFSKVNHPGTVGLNVSAPARAAADTAVDQVATDALQALPRH